MILQTTTTKKEANQISRESPQEDLFCYAQLLSLCFALLFLIVDQEGTIGGLVQLHNLLLPDFAIWVSPFGRISLSPPHSAEVWKCTDIDMNVR